ncbi:MAG: N-acetylmuramoyl-L-alanine amidase [Pseudomonadota bacterium]|nr:N-acetylmuramoyl-L-alanine amidase [Pseudomonadota bacterium]
MIRAILLALTLLLPAAASAQGFSALARVLPKDSSLQDAGDDLRLQLGLSQGVPFRVFTLDAPTRLVLDFQEVDWSALAAGTLGDSAHVLALRYGGYVPGWSRMVLELDGPMNVAQVAMTVDDETSEAMLQVMLEPTDAESFAAQAGAPQDPRWDLPEPEPIALAPDRRRDGPLVVMLDPGHGGLDPGAETEYNGTYQNEKSLMLRFAYELGEILMRSGEFEVVLTREGDYFVSLERRIAMAHQVDADLFVSLHADALAEGLAHGASIYVLSEEASDVASAKLAERHDRAQLLSGTDLSGTDDAVTDIMLDLARQETQPRSEALAASVVRGLQSEKVKMYRRPLQSAGFSVLKSADIPSILVEVGYLSSPKDAANITNPEWRATAARGIMNGIRAWRSQDEAQRALVRQ